MAFSQWPAVVDALVSLLTAALPSVKVYDGVGVSEDVGDYLMIGVEDANVEAAAVSGRIKQSRLAFGGPREESGVITCAAMSWNGDGNQKAARDAAFAIVAAVENVLRTTAPTLNLSTVMKTEFGEDVTPSQNQGSWGADCMVIFQVAYLAQI